MNGWQHSPYQTFKHEWFMKEIDETHFEILHFEPYKRKGYHQYGGIFQLYKIDINRFSKEEQGKYLLEFGIGIDDEEEEITNGLIAECLCESPHLNLPKEEFWSETLEGLNEILKQKGIDLEAYQTSKQGEIKSIEFKLKKLCS